jgi:hypothetical protein
LTLDSGIGVIRPEGFILNRLLPSSFRRKQLLNKLRKHYSDLIVRNSASIAYDLTYKIQESFRKFNYDLNNRFVELLESIQEIIEHTIQQKNKAEDLIDQDVKDLKEKIMKMASIKMEATE